MSHGGKGEGQIIAEFSTEVEEAQKCTDRSDQRLHRQRSTLTSPLQKKIPQCLCIPFGRILTERSQESGGAPGVLAKRWFLDATMRSEPITKGDHEC
jgi:hypothetical protein